MFKYFNPLWLIQNFLQPSIEPVVMGAGIGALGSAVTGRNPLQGALLGGATGGILGGKESLLGKTAFGQKLFGSAAGGFDPTTAVGGALPASTVVDQSGNIIGANLSRAGASQGAQIAGAEGLGNLVTNNVTDTIAPKVFNTARNTIPNPSIVRDAAGNISGVNMSISPQPQSLIGSIGDAAKANVMQNPISSINMATQAFSPSRPNIVQPTAPTPIQRKDPSIINQENDKQRFDLAKAGVSPQVIDLLYPRGY